MTTNASKREDALWVAGSALLALALFLLRYGYGFGYSDQDEFVPLAMRLVDSQLFATDAFVAMQLEGFTIRMPMAWLVALPSFVLPLWSVVFILHMGSILGAGWAVARLAARFTDRRWVITVATVAVVALTARWNPGGNDILHGMLVPSSVAWCLLLWAFERLIHQRYLEAGVLAALGTLFHPLVGMQVGAVLALHVLLVDRTNHRGRLLVIGPWMLMVGLALVLFGDLGAESGASGLSASTVLTHWRAPHHYLPWAFRWQDALQLLVLLVGASVLAARLPADHPDRRTAWFLLAAPATILIGSLLLTWWPLSLDWALRLQPWALSPILRLWSALLLVTLGAGLLPRRPERTERSAVVSPSVLLLLAGGAAVSLVLATLGPDIRGAAHPDRELHAWAAENTHPDAVFVIPPSMTGFQAGAQRAQYVSFKSFPFASGPTVEWWNRLQRMAPVLNPEPGGIALQTRLDSSWAQQTVADLHSFVETEPVDFLVRPASDPANWSAEVKPQWCGQEWCVYWAGRILRTHPASALQ